MCNDCTSFDGPQISAISVKIAINMDIVISTKEIMFVVSFVCVSFCLSTFRGITPKAMNLLQRIFLEGSGVVKSY